MTQPSTDRSVRKLRHSIQKRAYAVLMLGRGKPGLTQDQQVMILDKQIELLNEALEKATEARKIVSTRDFTVYKEAKDAQAAKEAATHDQIADGEEKAMEALTFDQIIGQLAGDDATKDDESTPPPF